MSSETDTESDGGYVHQPDTGESTGESVESTEPAGSFGQQGWALVVIVVLSFLVVPGMIYVFPSIPASFGIPYIAAFLALPMIPAVLLGLTAVWSMTAATNGRD